MPVYSAHENCVLAALVAETVCNLYFGATFKKLEGEMPNTESGSVLICTTHEEVVGNEFIVRVNPKMSSSSEPTIPDFGRNAATVLVLNMRRYVEIVEMSDEFIIELAEWHQVLFPGSKLRAKKRFRSWRQVRCEEKSAVVRS